MLKQIKCVLEERVRPQLALHGGDIQSLSCEDGVYRFRLLGQCAGCPSADLTAEEVIQEDLFRAVSGLKEMVLIHQVSGQLLEQAWAILERRHG
jgi:Fe-S cluster biogenesis protein NfuA